jgi:hypothetical protein
MRNLLKASGTVAAVAFAAFSPSAIAQENAMTYTCQDIGVGPPEPLGDREGHSLSVVAYSCRVDSGPLAGGVMTGSNVWEFDGPNAVLRSSIDVVRKPGATSVYQESDAKIALTITGGKVTGFTASGKGTWLVASGSAASLAGKSTSWTAESTGPGQFTIEEKWQ